MRRRSARLGTVVLRNLLLGTNVAALSLLSSPRTMLTYVTETLFLFNTMHDRRGIPQKNVSQVLPTGNVAQIVLGSLEGDNFFFHTASYGIDIVALSLICQAIKPKVVFEIGTFRGYSAFHFALNSPEDCKIYTLDLPPDTRRDSALTTTSMDEQYISMRMSGQSYAFSGSTVVNKITCLFGDSGTFDFEPYHQIVDFFFIDGAHSYEYVRSDTLNALKCCHSGSVIAWHDFGRMGVNGVSKWLVELARTGQEIFAVPGGSVAFTIVK
jgi:hypothetical protein